MAASTVAGADASYQVSTIHHMACPFVNIDSKRHELKPSYHDR